MFQSQSDLGHCQRLAGFWFFFFVKVYLYWKRGSGSLKFLEHDFHHMGLPTAASKLLSNAIVFHWGPISPLQDMSMSSWCLWETLVSCWAEQGPRVVCIQKWPTIIQKDDCRWALIIIIIISVITLCGTLLCQVYQRTKRQSLLPDRTDKWSLCSSCPSAAVWPKQLCYAFSVHSEKRQHVCEIV